MELLNRLAEAGVNLGAELSFFCDLPLEIVVSQPRAQIFHIALRDVAQVREETAHEVYAVGLIHVFPRRECRKLTDGRLQARIGVPRRLEAPAAQIYQQFDDGGAKIA